MDEKKDYPLELREVSEDGRVTIWHPAHDSRPDTYAHRDAVRGLLMLCTRELEQRGHEHDASKLVSPEREAFDGLPHKLKDLEYGSPEYRAALQDPAIKQHQQINDHHPEHHGDLGIYAMDLFQLTEMICDWIAAGRRTANGDIFKSIDMNAKRFKYDDALHGLLTRTATRILALEAEAQS